MIKGRAWAEIDLGALRYNYEHIRSMIGDKKYLAVVKADAYGHGDERIAKELEKLGADWFAVATAEEGAKIRRSGITKPILVLGYTPLDEMQKLFEYNLTQALFSAEYGRLLSSEAKKAGTYAQCHIKLDTGMGRIGFSAAHPETLAENVKAALCENIKVTGIFTHFAVADEISPESREYTHLQFERFKNGCDILTKAGIDVGIRHCSNSAATQVYPEMRMDMVREGITQYGMAPSGETDMKFKLRPVMSVYSLVEMVKTIDKGDTVSYGRKFTAEGKTKVATVCIGYADGYRRSFGNKARVIINGKYAPVIGRVCMDQMMVDVTDIDDVKMGDVVVIAGESGDKSVTLDELAAIDNTINYEIACGFTQRVARVYK